MIEAPPQLHNTDAGIQRLFSMLGTCRPHGSVTEHDFIDRFLLSYGMEVDGYGNLWFRIGTAPILWSSHVDTCHRRDGTQQFQIDSCGIVRLAEGSPSNCLGADCTAGVWLMTEMIEAAVPGLYVIHRGEERGGLGSRYIAEQEPERLNGIRAAIAFDRRGTHSVITHQSGERSCSDAFATSLSRAINLDHQADPTGTFTDTANYTSLVGECTNISVGYDREHTPHETLDLEYLLQLRQAVVSIDTSILVFSREAGELEFDDQYLYSRGSDGYCSPISRTLYDLVRDHPAAVAEFLETGGVTARELQEYVEDTIPF